MTDGQWLWLFINQIIDNEEHLEKMCPECRSEATSNNKCIRCGKVLTNDEDKFVNPNFDADRFERLSHGGVEYEEDVDVELIKQMAKGGVNIG